MAFTDHTTYKTNKLQPRIMELGRVRSTTPLTVPDTVDDHEARPIMQRGQTIDSMSTICTWAMGWMTPALMLASYVLALLIALVHMCFYLWLRDKHTTDIRQSYVTTTSTIMSTLVGLLLRICLGCVFTQYLWHLLRVKVYKASIIDDMFIMRRNVLALGRSIIRPNAWLLVVISLFLWTTPVAVSFVPGAIEVVPEYGLRIHTIPTFAKFSASSTFTEIRKTSIVSLTRDENGMLQQHLSDNTSYAMTNPALLRIAKSTMMNGEIGKYESSCGSDCMYTFNFSGPYLNCSVNKSYKLVSKQNNTYNAYWSNEKIVNSSSNKTGAYLNITYLRLHHMIDETPDSPLNVSRTILRCLPARARYSIDNIYERNEQKIKVSTNFQRILSNLETPVDWSATRSDEEADRQKRKAFIEDANIMAIIQAMSQSLNGTLRGSSHYRYTDENNSSRIFNHTDAEGRDWYNAEFLMEGSSDNTNNIVLNTPLSSAWIPFGWWQNDPRIALTVPFDINQDILNDLLANITLSMIPKLRVWEEENTVNRSLAQNIYVLSHPLNIVLPYGLTIGLTLPLLGLGMWALHSNGVSAQDGGFFQLLMTTRGSSELDKVARAGCLGGEENVPDRLKELKLRFGSFIDEQGRSSGVSLAGFGTDNEVVALRKGQACGG